MVRDLAYYHIPSKVFDAPLGWCYSQAWYAFCGTWRSNLVGELPPHVFRDR